MKLLLEILLGIVILYVFTFGATVQVYLFRKLILSDLVIPDKHEKDAQNIYANNEESIYETGFLEDMKDYDARIDDLREQLIQTKGNSPFIPSDINPSVEIITDEFESRMAHK